MVKVLYPGSFDPVHNGHMEICTTASRLFDHVVVAAMRNPQKSDPFFTDDERFEMLTEACTHLENVEVVEFGELVVDLADRLDVDFIIKGLRGAADFESELQMAQMNKSVSGVETLFLPSTSESAFIASKYIRDITRFGTDCSHLVPEAVALRLPTKMPK
ncbi:MAG: pantetheine-phosphate adenylyltransferase [Actinobacteria bacterium]|nr:pantetheine-phosphate adenylyltransferase [Actinomycetota bacterium]MCS5690163.1 pantetheine-phosphate adenylyltransferase [Acidimicrobiales bacterium]MEC8921757.1 pantetheine-phosphate adenylyltransferase [Actinomycetota bacterium]MED5551133.1 pantetheine-phosphate adenylyltransferase [Actinomycetota bacterium]MEE2680531.1 pantetheine-phosphate adenylyltransferase [Actinomycetota bacterium]